MLAVDRGSMNCYRVWRGVVSAQEISDLIQRLNRLEQTVWWWRSATILALSIMGAILLMGQASTSPRVIAIEKLILRDVNGKMRAMLYITPENAPTFTMGDKEGEPRIQMTVGQNGTPVIGLQDKNDIPRAMFTTESLSLYNKNEKLIWKAP